MEIPLVKDLIVIFGLSIVVLLFCYRLKIPWLVGLLITGVICGPNGLGAIDNIENVKVLAEIGVALLLFSVGLEISLKRLIKGVRQVLLGGSVQVFLTVLGGAAVGLFLQRGWGEAVFLGCLLSLSSTAIVMRILQERGEFGTAHGSLSISILIFQDLIVIMMLLFVPFLAKAQIEAIEWVPFITKFGYSFLTLLFVLVSGYYLFPRFLHMVARTKQTHLFLISVLFICILVAWVTAQVGFSIALGAFLAGLIISESEYNYHALGNIFPLQELFTSFFFISTGMFLKLSFVLHHFGIIALALVGLTFLKVFTGCISALCLGYTFRSALLTGLFLCQVGEFSFLLLEEGIRNQISSPYNYQLFISITLISMAIAPLIISYSEYIVDLTLYLPLPFRWKLGLTKAKTLSTIKRSFDVAIIGYGNSGKALALALREAKIPYEILEMSPEVLLDAKRNQEPIHFGDASHEMVLRHFSFDKARIVAVLTNELRTTKRVITSVRRVNPSAYLIVRTRRKEHIPLLLQLGADDVISDDFESSLGVFTKVLRKSLIPKDVIEKIASKMRFNRYREMLSSEESKVRFHDLKKYISALEIETLKVKKGSPLIGKNLRQTELRRLYGVTVLLIKREDAFIIAPTPETEIKEGDIVVLFAKPEKLIDVAKLFG